MQFLDSQYNPSGEVNCLYPFKANQYYLNLIDRSSKNPLDDPIAAQCLPSDMELKHTMEEDGLGEDMKSPTAKPNIS